MLMKMNKKYIYLNRTLPMIGLCALDTLRAKAPGGIVGTWYLKRGVHWGIKPTGSPQLREKDSR